MPTIAEVRAQYPQYKDMSDVELAGALHQKFYADMPADQFAEKIGLKPDKYQQAAIDEQADLKAKGIDPGAGYTRRLAHGATLGADNTLIAGALAPVEALTRGVGLGEGYNYAKAREDQIMDQSRANTGLLGSGVEALGGGVAGGAVTSGLGTMFRGAGGNLTAAANNGFTASRFLPSSLLGRTAALGADAAALGGIAGFNEGNSLSERAGNAATGALFGGAVGSAMPVVGTIAKGVASPFISNIMARLNPQGYAEKQVARAITESGRNTDNIARDVMTAANEGQGVYTVADALGNPGQRMLSTVARAPGEGRTAVVNVLEGRQGTQGRRVSNALSEGFDVPETALQTEARLTGARDDAADVAYTAVRNDAQRVDVVPAINSIDRTIGTGPGQTLNAANDTIEGTLRTYRERLSRVNPDDFEAVQRIRGEIADDAQNAFQNGKGNRGRLLKGVVRELDTAMENASEGHLAANRAFAQASRDIDAVGTGRQAATRGRTEDTIPGYQALTPDGQGAFRSGYVDPLIANAQGAAFGANKARPLLNDAFADEAAVMAPGNPLMQRRLAREQTMFETRNQALGNSKTADNLADADAMGIDPTMVGQILSGNWSGAARSVISAGSNIVSGNTPAVRAAVAEILLQRGASVTPAALDRMVGETIRKIQRVQRLAQSGGRVTAGAIASAVQQSNKKPKANRLFSR
jgi:hypothetical protein